MILNNSKPFRIVLDNVMLEALSERSSSLTKEQALIDLISRCVTEPTEVSKNNRRYMLQTGEAETSINVLAAEWKWDRKTVRRFLDTLQKNGCMKIRRHPYGTIAVFPSLICSPSQILCSSPSPNDDSSTSGPRVTPSGFQGVHEDFSVIQETNSIRYDDPPLTLSDDEQSQLKKIYHRFKAKLPLLHIPPYDQRTEKAIYSVFIQGMNADMELLEKYLDSIAGNPMKNGEMAELSGDAHDRESMGLFES